MEAAIPIPEVKGIINRLHVAPAKSMGNGAVLDAVQNALLQQPALESCTLLLKTKGKIETIRKSHHHPHGEIEVSVNNGIILLDDHVTNLAQKSRAGVLV